MRNNSHNGVGAAGTVGVLAALIASILVAASLALAGPSLAISSGASTVREPAARTTGCVSRTEFNRAQRGMTRLRIHRIFGAQEWFHTRADAQGRFLVYYRDCGGGFYCSHFLFSRSSTLLRKTWGGTTGCLLPYRPVPRRSAPASARTACVRATAAKRVQNGMTYRRVVSIVGRPGSGNFAVWYVCGGKLLTGKFGGRWGGQCSGSHPAGTAKLSHRFFGYGRLMGCP